ncbi:unnamed protein product [Echinostoma caproni]|uniref:Spindle pole body component n=1 Tax=Echinostoma caproni TaxID=27848 RepID=A0A183B9G4_9TREM|nr:unnamed protein product [Echinostoma caproni]
MNNQNTVFLPPGIPTVVQPIPPSACASKLPEPYHNFIAGLKLNQNTASNMVRSHVSYVKALCDGFSNTATPSLFPCADAVHLSDSELFHADLVTLLRDLERPSLECSDDHWRTDSEAHALLPELQDWPTRGLLDTEPLRVADDMSMHTLPADCVLERVDWFTGAEIPESAEQTGTMDEFSTALKQFCSPPEAYHLLITRMHAGAHRSVTLAFQSSISSCPVNSMKAVHLLTDVFIPASPYLTSIAIEALQSHPVSDGSAINRESDVSARLLAVSTEIGQHALVLRDLTPPVPFSRLRISLSARLDCKLSRARIHLGAFFGRSGLFDLISMPDPWRITRAWEFAWAAGQPLFCPSSIPTETIPANPLLDRLEQWKSDVLASLDLTQSELISWSTATSVTNNTNHSHEVEYDRKILTLYTRYWALRYQVNWLQRVSDRMVHLAHPAITHQLQMQMSSASVSDLIKSLSLDKSRNLMETVLQLLVAHSDHLSLAIRSGDVDVADPSKLSSSLTDLIPTDELHTIICSLLQTSFTYGTRAIQVLITGFTSSLLSLWYSIRPISSFHLFIPTENWLLNLITDTFISNPTRCAHSHCLDCTRRILAFWALIQRLVLSGLTDNLFITSLLLIRAGLNVSDSTSFPLAHLLNLFNAVCGSMQAEIRSGQRATNVESVVPIPLHATHQSMNNTGWSGLLTWYYMQQVHGESTSITEQSKTCRRSEFIRKAESLLRKYGRTKVTNSRPRTESSETNAKHSENTKDVTFPLGALFMKGLMMSRLQSLIRRVS